MAASTRIYLCPVPGEAMAESGELTFVIDGYVDGKRQRSVSDTLIVEAAPFIDQADRPADPTPTQAEQLQAQIDGIVETVQDAARSAADAEESANRAAEIVATVESAEDDAIMAKSYAVGGTGTREGEDTDNAKYWAEQAKGAAGGGDMQSATYDPQGKKTDIFKYVDEHAPSGSGVYISPDEPTGSETVWIDTDDASGGGGGGNGVYISPDEPTNGETVWYDTDDQQGSFYTAKQVDAKFMPINLGIQMVKVWENPNYSAEFPGQDIAIANASDYQMFAFICGIGGQFIPAAIIEKNSNAMVVHVSDVGKKYTRRFWVDSDKIAASEGKLDNVTNNTINVPYKIYGIKGVQ